MICLHLLLLLTAVSGQTLQTISSWRSIDYNFPNDTIRRAYQASGDYIPLNIIPVGVNVWGDRMFITTPRLRNGVPSTLNYVSLSQATMGSPTSPLLIPYPSWELNDMRLPGALINVVRVRIDACDRLWTVDSGLNNAFGTPDPRGPTRLVAINLNTNEIILSYTFKDSDVRSTSFLADTVVDVDPDNCNDAYIYNSDPEASGLVVYSLARNDSWRIETNYFCRDPLNGNFNVNGLRFQWPDGIFGMSLSPRRADGSKTFYFHSTTGIHEFSVSTSLLKNQTALADRLSYEQYRIEGLKGSLTQGTSSVYDPQTGIIYFTQVSRNAIACWNTAEPLNPDTFRTIAKDDINLSFPNDIIIEPRTRRIYVLSDNLPVIQLSDFDLSRTNFGIHSASLDSLTPLCQRQVQNVVIFQEIPAAGLFDRITSSIQGIKQTLFRPRT